MRPPAQVREISLGVERDGFGRDVRQDFQLVLFAHGFEHLFGLGLAHGAAGKGMVGGGDLFHLGLDCFQILGGEGPLEGKVVVEAVLDGRADGDLGRGKQLFHGLGQHVGRGVADDVHTLGAVRGNGRYLAARVGQRGGTNPAGPRRSGPQRYF